MRPRKGFRASADGIPTPTSAASDSGLDAEPSGVGENRAGDHTDIEFDRDGLEDPREALRKAHSDSANAAEIAEDAAPNRTALPRDSTGESPQ